MKDNIRKFLEDIANQNMSYEDASDQAQKLLDEELKKEVKNAFNWRLTGSSYKEEAEKAIKERNIIELIFICHSESDAIKIIKNNLNNMDKIFDMLDEYIEELKVGKEGSQNE